MSITELSKAVEKPERFVGVHYFFPAVLMKLVEVIRGDATSDETTAFAKAYAEHVGKTVVVAQKDRPGFIANRIVAPVVSSTTDAWSTVTALRLPILTCP